MSIQGTGKYKFIQIQVFITRTGRERVVKTNYKNKRKMEREKKKNEKEKK